MARKDDTPVTLNPSIRIAWEAWLKSYGKDAFTAIRDVALAVEKSVWARKKEWERGKR